MDETMINKFMDSMGITYEVEGPIREYYNPEHGGLSACFKVRAWHEDELEYEIHVCYSFNRKTNELRFDEGNVIIDINRGIFKYLGINKEIHNFFQRKAKIAAEQFFRDYYNI